MRFLLTTTAAFAAVVVSGGIWIGLVQQAIPGESGTGIAVIGGVFSAAFIWLLLLRLRSLLAHPERRFREAMLLVANIALVIVAFAWAHHRIGLVDMSGPGPRPSQEFADAVYFSIVTITTLGYGDFIPIGTGRAIAAMQALVGYFILGILVSTGFQLIAPHTAPGEEARRRREAREAESEEEGDDGEEEP